MPDEQHDYYKFPRPTPYQPGQFNQHAQSVQAQQQPQPQQYQSQAQFQPQQAHQPQYAAQSQPQQPSYQPAYVQPQQFQQPQQPHQAHVQPNQHYYQQPAQPQYQAYAQPQQQSQAPAQTQAVPTNGNGMFQRRMGRLSFLLGFVYILLAFIGPIMLQFFMSYSNQSGSAMGTLVKVLCILLGLAGGLLVVPVVISLYIRRLHDLNHPGIMWLFMLVPAADFFFLLYLLFAPGTKGINNYGMPVKSKNFFVVLGLKKPKPVYTQGPAYPAY